MSVSPRCSGILVDGEARAERRELEEDAARLAEVDGAEPEAVDDRRRVRAGGCDPRVPCVLLVHLRRPRDVVHRPCAAQPALGRRLVVGVEAAARRAARLPRVRRPTETNPSVSSSSPRLGSGSANARTASNPCSACSAGTSGCSAMSGVSSTVDTTSRWRRPSGHRTSRSGCVTRCACLARSLPSQKSSAASDPTRHCTVCTIPTPALPRRTPGYSKNVMSLPGVPASSA